jgi:hypothetical protein
MSLKSAPYWWVDCDNCGERCDYGDFAAWAEVDHAIDGAIESEWTTDGSGKYHCTACPQIAKCERCGKDAGDDPMDRDDHCPECWAIVSAEDVPS